MRQAYNTPDMTIVRLPQGDIITDSQQTMTVDFNRSTTGYMDVGAPNRIRDYE